MPITRTPMVDDDGTGTTGTIINNAWKQELYGQIDALAVAGAQWVNVPYSAANFTGTGGMVWTVESADQVTFAYLSHGTHAVELQFDLVGTSVSGTPGTPLHMTIPFTLTKTVNAIVFGHDGTASVAVRAYGATGGNGLDFYRMDGLNWSLNTVTQISGQLVLQV